MKAALCFITMSNPQNQPDPSHASGSRNKLQRPRNFWATTKLLFWSFLAGFATCATGGGYVLLHAEKFNFPVSIKGNNNTQSTDTNTGHQTGDSNSGVTGNGNIGRDSGVRDIIAGDGAKIDIKISPQDPNFKNINLPGYFPDKGFESKPPQLDNFQGARVFTRDSIRSGYAYFSSDEPVIGGKTYKTVFYLSGSNNEVRRVAFKLNGQQKAVLLQFGLADLDAGDANLTYQVDISADGRRIWSGKVIYGTSQQIVSVPIEISGVETLRVEYIVAQGSIQRNLYFTRAELLYN